LVSLVLVGEGELEEGEEDKEGRKRDLVHAREI
jgi:hypothetical protein